MKSFINCVWRLASLWASDVSDEVGSLAGSESGSSVGEISELVLNGLDPCKNCVLVFQLGVGAFYSKVKCYCVRSNWGTATTRGSWVSFRGACIYIDMKGFSPKSGTLPKGETSGNLWSDTSAKMN